jgi:hypothetical protein
MKGIDGLCSTSQRYSHSRSYDAVVPVRWNGPPHPLGEDQHRAKDGRARPVAFRRAYGSVHNCDDGFAHFGDSAVGRVLSLALSSIMGVFLLLLGHQLFDRWLWGRCSPANLALPGPSRGRYRCADVWPVRERPVRYPSPVGRGPILNGDQNVTRFDLHFQAELVNSF